MLTAVFPFAASRARRFPIAWHLCFRPLRRSIPVATRLPRGLSNIAEEWNRALDSWSLLHGLMRLPEASPGAVSSLSAALGSLCWPCPTLPLPFHTSDSVFIAGKTSLARALSTTLSTASLDKHPQSQAGFLRPKPPSQAMRPSTTRCEPHSPVVTGQLRYLHHTQERGITLDLGFSSFIVPLPAHIKARAPEYDAMQFTLVRISTRLALAFTENKGTAMIRIQRGNLTRASD